MISKGWTLLWLPSIFFLVIFSALEAKEQVLLQMKSVADTSNWVAEGGVVASFSTDNLSAGRAGWIKAVFSGTGQRIALTVPHLSPMPRYQANYLPTLISTNNFWRGYDSLKIDCYNAGAQPVTVGIDISDFVAAIVKQKLAGGPIPANSVSGYRYRKTAILSPGAQTISLCISGALPASNGERDISTLDVRNVGIDMAGSGAASLYFDNFRLVSTSDLAGTYGYVWRNWGRTPCTNTYDTLSKDAITKTTYADHFSVLHALGFQDPYASHCPFCGYKLRAGPLEPQSGGENVLLGPSEARLVHTNVGDGNYEPATRPWEDWRTPQIRHYDEGFYIWDSRGYYVFNLSGFTKSVKKVEFRYYLDPTKPDMISTKVWFPPLQIWSIDDKYDNAATAGLSYIKQPPLKQLLVQGGLYPWNLDKYQRSGDGPLLTTISHYGLDVTQYINEQLLGDKKAVMVVMATVSYPANSDPHGLGHYVEFADGPGGMNDRVHLYVEFGTPPEVSNIVSVRPLLPWARLAGPDNFVFQIPQKTKVQIAVTNTRGQRCATLINETRGAGLYTESLRKLGFANMGSGTYILNLTAGESTQSLRFVSAQGR